MLRFHPGEEDPVHVLVKQYWRHDLISCLGQSLHGRERGPHRLPLLHQTGLVEQNGLLSEPQRGFRHLRSTTQQAQSLQWVIQGARTTKELLHVMCLNFENTFNSADHEVL